MRLDCPHCKNAFEIVPDDSIDEVTCPSCKSRISLVDFLSLSDSRTVEKTQDIAGVELHTGDELSHFRLEDQIGRGGFGTVYKAYDTKLDRNVALKIPRFAGLTPTQVSFFLREARAAAQLRNPNIVSVFEIGKDKGRVFIVSELIDGMTLKEWRRSQKPDQKTAARMVEKLARAIHQAHEVGVVHRDLKPSNVILDASNEPHITDFGLAKRERAEEITLTTKGSILGTPSYMSPEQATGNSEFADRRSDVYSLGIILYELLCDQRPFRGNTDLLIEEIKSGEFTAPREINSKLHPDVEAICLKSMALNPTHRYQSALEFADDLKRFSEGSPTLVRPMSSVEKGLAWSRKNIAAISVSLAVLLLVSIIIALVSQRDEPLIGESSNEKKTSVTFEVKPNDASVVMAYVDMTKGYIDYENLLKPAKNEELQFEISLKPGLYLIEATSSLGVQEVYRMVPASALERRALEYRATNWTPMDDGRIQLQPISVKPIVGTNDENVFLLGPERLCKVSGGKFRTGNNEIKRLTGDLKNISSEIRKPEMEIQMDDFYLGEVEVSALNFQKVMGHLPIGMKIPVADLTPEHVASHVTWYEAIEYCERIGARLPIFDEYLFAATNKGTTAYPFGEVFPFENWEIELVKEPESDKNKNSPPIMNLFSSVGEWGWDIDVSLDLTPKAPTGPNLGDPRLNLMRDSRLVFGLATANLDQFDPSQANGPRLFIDNDPVSSKLHNGFRVAKSSSIRITAKTKNN